ncbi:arrestin domain-containing protein 3-like [Pagrus major]|uniref:arrestin domain-containing protein 3-like n=1 Tax=Pagrus major TaxID=143350 RepID=UPI003CC84CFE
MSPIKDFRVIYDALNEENTFSEGDPVAGTVTFTLTKDTKVKSLMVKVKGDANVRFTKSSGGSETTYIAHTRYFKVKKYFVEESPKGTVLPKGVHHFKFRLDIPHRNMPSSFKGKHGKIIYKLEVKISRSWRWPSEIDHELNFVSKSLSHLGQVMCPQSGSVDKEVGVFSKGQVKMSATVNRTVFSPGDTLYVAATICNSSSKEMTPKFSLQQKIEYHTSDSTHSRDKSLWKMVGETLAPNSEKTVLCHRRIPNDVIHSLYNCGLISVEHYLMVYLDISFAFDPEVKLPLVIIPSRFATLPPGEAFGPYPAGTVGGPSKSDLPPPAVAMGPSPAGAVGGPSKSDLPPPAVAMDPSPAGAVGAPSYSDFPPPAFPTGSYGVPTAPGAYGYPSPGPTQPGNTTSGYNNQLPQQAPPYSFPAAAFSPPSVQHQGPTPPPLFQQGEDPPTYMSLFHPSHDTYGSNGSEKKT